MRGEFPVLLFAWIAAFPGFICEAILAIGQDIR